MNRCKHIRRERREARLPYYKRCSFTTPLGIRRRARTNPGLHVRLTQIKLSGFKSFVDPTTIDVPGQLVGVVGPNGCGKSNIIDAVRWVLGESQGQRAARRVDAGRDLQRLGRPQARPAAPASSWCSTTTTAAPAAQWSAVRRDRGQARADARRHVELLHQQPAGAPARHARHVPRHRPRAARLRDHRPGHDLAHHRGEARGAAHVPRGGRRRLEVQGAPPRDREPAGGHAREPDARRRHPARARTRSLEQARAAGRGRAARTATLQGDATTQAAPAVVPASATRRGRARKRIAREIGEADAPRSRRACAELRQRRDASSRRCARRTTRRATRCTRRRARCTRPTPRSAGSKRRSATCVEGRAARRAAQLAELTRRRARRGSRRDARTSARRDRRRRADRALRRATGRALAAQVEDHGAHAAATRRRAARTRKRRATSSASAVGAGAAADPGARRRTAQHRRAARAAAAARASGCAEEQAPRRARRRAARSAAGAKRAARAGARSRPTSGCTTQAADSRRSTTTAARQRSADARTREAAQQADLAARLRRAARAAGEGRRPRASSKPWLAKHGLDSAAAACGSSSHIEPGWETALEAALRERARRARGRPARHGAALRGRRAAGQAGVLHARRRGRARCEHAAALPRLSDLLRLSDAGLTALLGDWLAGVYTADDLDEALAARDQLRPARSS